MATHVSFESPLDDTKPARTTNFMFADSFGRDTVFATEPRLTDCAKEEPS